MTEIFKAAGDNMEWLGFKPHSGFQCAPYVKTQSVKERITYD